MLEDAQGHVEDAARVRAVLSRELETISHYESMARSARTPEVRDFLLHLAGEEKEHVAEAIAVLSRLDPTQSGHLKRPVPPEHFKQTSRETGRETVSRPPRETHDPRFAADPRLAIYTQPAPPFPDDRATGQLTVGHLKGAP